MNYIFKDSALPPYLPLPKFLLSENLKQTSQLTYALLLDRVTLSQANGWQDGQGHVYVIFPVERIAQALRKGLTSVKAALAELEEHGLIQRQRAGPGQPNVSTSCCQTAGKATILWLEIRLQEGRQSDHLTVRIPAV